MGIIEGLLCRMFPHIDIHKEGKLYLRRWFLTGPAGGWSSNASPEGWLVLHKIYQSDHDRDPHDHPGDFETRILWGSYVDHTFSRIESSGGKPYRFGPERDLMSPGRYAYRKAGHLHKVELVDGKPAWTLVKLHPYTQEWGFVLPDGVKVHHEVYLNPQPDVINMDLVRDLLKLTKK